MPRFRACPAAAGRRWICAEADRRSASRRGHSGDGWCRRSGGSTGGAAAGPGGTSSFGQFVNATGGSLNYLATPSAPENGATPPGSGSGAM